MIPATVTATGTITTGSATPVLATSMTLTPGPGTFIVFASCSVEAPNTQTVTVELFNNGSTVTASQRLVKGDAGLTSATAIGSVSMAMPIVVTTGAVEIRWSTTGGTASMFNRVLMLWQVTG